MSDFRESSSKFYNRDEPTTPEQQETWEAAWPDPKPLRVPEHGDDYPIGQLPLLIQNAVIEVQAVVQAPDALVASSALSVVSAAVAPYVSVERDEKLRGPASLFFLTVAESGERKSSCDSRFNQALKRWEQQQKSEAKPVIVEYEADEQSWKAIEQGLENALRKAASEGKDTAELEKKMREHLVRKPMEPFVAQMLREDDTPEALRVYLAKKCPVAAILSAEAGVIFGGHAMNGDSAMRNLGQLNKLWSGEPIKDGRVTRDGVDLNGDARVTVGLMVQPKVLSAFMSKQGDLARGIGYFARFFLSEPESTMGERFYRQPVQGSPSLWAFEERVAWILNHKLNVDAEGKLITTYLPLDPEAKQVWIDFHDDVERQLTWGMEFFNIRDVASKAAENAARLACCFHFFCTGMIDLINKDYMQRAVAITRWHLDEALRFAGRETEVPDEVLLAEVLEIWMAKFCIKKKVVSVGLSEITHIGPKKVRPKAKRDAALDLLISHNRTRRVVSKDGQRTEIYVNPLVLDEYRTSRSVSPHVAP